MTAFVPFPLSALVVLAAGCAYPNQFYNVRIESPHANLGGYGVKLTHINDQPTSFWRSSEQFRILPGPNTVRVIAGYRGDIHYPLLKFTAQADRTYSVQPEQPDNFDHIVLREGSEHVVAEAEKESIQ